MAIAEIIKKEYTRFDKEYGKTGLMCILEGKLTCRSITDKLADYFASNNPNFDREKFLKACGL